ncbi:DUF2334 domain-containing protein [Sphingomonas panacisoli]|uniref:DUF2334 domain-containing protein n=1 Tax=Sphingomonas panacisoli TaxID=1813879 RepID=A0A5B8LHW7_9SPHN|nr:polysaccharide deacetylase family protein [Sphingomonas panacisoli]QDZ07907.1 DUF2334 domain-containing protein [Sphingomonas panacisoli]
MVQASSQNPQVRRLIVSIHDVSPRHEGAIDRLQEQLERHGARTPAMLVVPNFWGEAPIVRGTPFATRLREWADRGIEMFLHGSEHRDTSRHDGWIKRLKANHMTAGEGEFLGLSGVEAATRIAMGRTLIEDIIGQPVAGFVAPAWLYGPGAIDALQSADIGIVEDHWRVWDAGSGRTLARSPVITWATRTPVRQKSSLAVAAIVRSIPGPRVMRLAVHPGDVGSDRVRRSISRTLDTLRRHRAISRYADLVDDTRSAA